MDCFYAAIEEREDPSLIGKPIAVGGSSPRSVLCTANYKAREFGCKSAMPAFKATQLCPELIILPVRMELYKEVSSQIREIYRIFTTKIEPLSLDEAYLDVSHAHSSPSSIAREIRHLIQERTQLTASAGIGPNKMIAKIASDWNKPNGQFAVSQEEVPPFMHKLPLKCLWGVGKQSLKRLDKLNISTCGELQRYSKIELYQLLGNWGSHLYELARGIDEREVKPSRKSKSISKETTFSENIEDLATLYKQLSPLLEQLAQAMQQPNKKSFSVKTAVIKLKFADFTQTTVEKGVSEIDPQYFLSLLNQAWQRGNGKPVRLLGAGLKFHPPDPNFELDFSEPRQGS